jgi:TonB family protein
MRRATRDRIDHAVAAGAVLGAHVVLTWIAVQVHAHYAIGRESFAPAEPVIATLIERPRNRSLGPVPIHVKTEHIVRLQGLVPKIPDIPVDTEVTIADALPQPASAPTAGSSDAGLAGNASASGGHAGGGYVPTLLQRVVPKYPTRAARLREEGATAVHIRVDESGRVSEVRIVRSSGSRRLDDAALDAVRKWKFARMPQGAAPEGAWVASELRFILYRFTYSRLGEGSTDHLYVEQVKVGAADEATPGSHEALGRFIAEMRAGNFSGEPAGAGYTEITKMRAALEEWGDVKSIRFTGAAGGPEWLGYEVERGRPGHLRPSVEVRWNMFEVLHQNATSEWLIAVDRAGTIWTARASRAPWL